MAASSRGSHPKFTVMGDAPSDCGVVIMAQFVRPLAYLAFGATVLGGVVLVTMFLECSWWFGQC